MQIEPSAAALPALVPVPGGASGAADLVLPEEVRRRIGAAVPENTARNWASRWRAFALWCLLADRSALPATAETLAAYLDARTRDFEVPAHLRRLAGQAGYKALRPTSLGSHLGTLRAMHRINGYPSPDPFLANQVIKARSRELAADAHAEHGVRQATPLRGRDIAKMIDTIDTHTPAGLRDKALLLLAYKTGRRGAEIAGLNLADVREVPNPLDPTLGILGLRITFRVSKTNPHGLRQDDTIKIKRVGGAYCPASAVRAWRLDLGSRGHRTGPLFPRIDQHGHLGTRAGGRQGVDDDGRITPKTVHAIITRRATDAGLVPEDGYLSGPDGLPVRVQISAHSTRRGFVTDAFTRLEADPEKIGRHAGFAPGSRTLYRYRDIDLGWDDDPTDGLLSA